MAYCNGDGYLFVCLKCVWVCVCLLCAFVGVRVCGQFARKGWRGVVTAGSNNGGGGS